MPDDSTDDLAALAHAPLRAGPTATVVTTPPVTAPAAPAPTTTPPPKKRPWDQVKGLYYRVVGKQPPPPASPPAVAEPAAVAPAAAPTEPATETVTTTEPAKRVLPWYLWWAIITVPIVVVGFVWRAGSHTGVIPPFGHLWFMMKPWGRTLALLAFAGLTLWAATVMYRRQKAGSKLGRPIGKIMVACFAFWMLLAPSGNWSTSAQHKTPSTPAAVVPTIDASQTCTGGNLSGCAGDNQIWQNHMKAYQNDYVPRCNPATMLPANKAWCVNEFNYLSQSFGTDITDVQKFIDAYNAAATSKKKGS